MGSSTVNLRSALPGLALLAFGALAACGGPAASPAGALPSAQRPAAPAARAPQLNALLCAAQSFPSATNTSGFSDAPPCDPIMVRGLPAVRPPHLAAPPSGQTTAWGTLVDDATDYPLPGYAVVLYPGSPGCARVGLQARCPAPLPYRTLTKHRGQFVLPNVPNGTYLLVIGSDSPSDQRRPTIHDLVTLTGGIQRILAPVLAREPTQNPPPPYQSNLPAVPIPPVQKTVLFRLSALHVDFARRALHCWQDFRFDAGLPLGVADEWLIENAGAVDETANAYVAWGVPAYAPLLSSAADGTPYPPCPAFGNPSEGAFADVEAFDPRTLWIGGAVVDSTSGAVSGLIEWKPDPRSVIDPRQGNGISRWP